MAGEASRRPCGKLSAARGNSRAERSEPQSAAVFPPRVYWSPTPVTRMPNASPRRLPPSSRHRPAGQLHLTGRSLKENHSTWKLARFRPVLQAKNATAD